MEIVRVARASRDQQKRLSTAFRFIPQFRAIHRRVRARWMSNLLLCAGCRRRLRPRPARHKKQHKTPITIERIPASGNRSECIGYRARMASLAESGVETKGIPKRKKAKCKRNREVNQLAARAIARLGQCHTKPSNYLFL